MSHILELTDIQGNVVLAYKFPLSRYILLRVTDAAGGRDFLQRVLPHITSGELWEDGEKPEATTNISFTCKGLEALGVPQSSIRTFPVAYQEGMKARADILGDTGSSAPDKWDDCWKGDVHILLSINARTVTPLKELSEITEAEKKYLHDHYEALKHLWEASGGVEWLGEQDGNVLFYDGHPCAKEHFGFTDGIGNPAFSGMDLKPMQIPGRGKQLPDGRWVPLAAGEFVLGYPDEAQELPLAPVPHLLSRNGTFMAYRKLHQNVATFRKYLVDQGKKYEKTLDMSKYRHADGREVKGWEVLAAKMAGRWLDGTPIELSPFGENPEILNDPMKNNDFDYKNDTEGARCPVGGHVRRANPRDALGFQGQLTNRRRILRRGLPYGKSTPFDKLGNDDGEHGIIFMSLNASIERQFEFVQQQWMNYGNDFIQGNDKDILVGDNDGTTQAVIQNDPDGDRPPFICADIPRFVEVRGGDYFFIPSLTALRMISNNAISTI
ncbi:Dyp-type peroxidase [Emcibacter sp.]|uniref:Dyp-type peroxidase n=1 Tax=Emcibacter sp. TaxID=1979954 RepID=UPI003A8F5DA1